MNKFPEHPADPPPRPVQNIVFGAILLLLFIAVCRLFSPFFTVLLWSILLYILLSPLHNRLVKKLDLTKPGGMILKNFWAAVFALGTVILIILPIFFVVFQFFKQIIEFIYLARDVFNNRPGILQDVFQSVAGFIENITANQVAISGDDIQRRIVVLLTSSLQNLVVIGSDVARHVGTFVVGLFLMLFCLFFFYIDGPVLAHLVLRAIPIRKEYLTALVGKFKDITRNLFFGYIMVILLQAVMAFIIFSIFRIKGALVLAVLTLIAVSIPIFGGSLVWLPIGIVKIVNGEFLPGLVFIIVSGFFISLLDNFLRPFFLQDRLHLHPLIIFLAILGGVGTLGFNGLVLGPIVVIIFLTVLDLFLMEHKIEEQD
ncbi:MAG: AI-2E family transporter [Treponema sp.]|jgi:predicted PurR-regulated permease PerM|nr:AI-2E family transporter [Treponema sp.]